MNNQNIKQHFENVRAVALMALQRGIFSDFETAIAVKVSLDALEIYLKETTLTPELAPDKSNGALPAEKQMQLK